MTELSVTGLIGALGLALGSFLNVCIYRLPKGQSVLGQSSRCPVCERELRWFENVPVLAWVLLGGRCRICKAAVSPTYPIVELATAALFMFYYWHFGLQPLLIVRLLFAASMVVLCVVDFQTRELPGVITVPGMAIGLGVSLLLEPGWPASLIGVVTGGGYLWLINKLYLQLCGREGIGSGDVKLLAMIGAFRGWEDAFVTLWIGSLFGLVIAGLRFTLRKKVRGYRFPLGSFLSGVALVPTYQPLLGWYVRSYYQFYCRITDWFMDFG
ncbi:MAG: prepilin peptidase [Acidobacteria bacterium]|nr:prepilin peptidase [Acidobacteriota bacterium]